MQNIIALTPAKLDCLLDCMAQLTAVAVAQIAEDGRLLHANLGFKRLTRHGQTGAGTQPDLSLIHI